MKKVTIYTDGACTNNPGPGGWAAILNYKDCIKEIYGGEPLTTNNRMELTAAIKALEALKEPCCVELYSDSAYLINAFNQHWVNKWMRNGWKTTGGDPVENKDLWERLIELTKMHDIKWVKVKGHSNNEYNNRCDELAKNAIK
ncbi:ribonuclease HI [Mahella sp.]|uniref:ribonuclease HI n=1 Tax=Mahella sp. TaxID=2798721 RepID=UPI0025B83DC2|nr:ribonuclease HI [Mahella sp.]MBZ4664765.1 RNase [Mahella sp.]MDK2903808.1 ribonuclease [Clostridiales bacterium]